MPWIKKLRKESSGLDPEKSPLWYSLLDQVLRDMNTNLEDAVCSDPLYVQEYYHDDSNIFGNEEEDTDKKPMHWCLTNQSVN